MKQLLGSLYRALAAASVIAALCTATSSAQAAPVAHHGPINKLRHGTSSNWSGYAAYGANGSFTSVSASWTQPSMDCSSGDGYSSYWVGLDGYNTSTVEQLGTEGDCSGGTATFYAWYEMYPHAGYYAQGITVHAGDVFNASVSSRNGSFTLSLRDVTTSKNFSITQKMNQAKRASAEVVLEAPWSGGTLPLANFGTANFTNAQANGKPLGSFSPLDPITMLNPAGMKATPSSFDSTNQNFSVKWSAS